MRSALFNLCFVALTAIGSLVGTGIAPFAPRRIVALARLWARLNLGALRLLCGIRVVVSGREHLPTGGAALIAPQHQSAFDTLVWLTLLPDCCYVLKRELLRLPLFGRLTRIGGMILLDRSGGAAALRHLRRETLRAVREGRQIVIFPEGTRVAFGSRARLHPGIAAMQAASGLPILPARTDSGRLWGRRAFRKLPGTIHIDLAPPIPPGLDRAAVMARIEAAFAGPAEGVENSVGTAATGFADDRKSAK
ncbi:MAG: lysophospholipid acyltransferase family protein [Acetobacteraceae bacterium]